MALVVVSGGVRPHGRHHCFVKQENENMPTYFKFNIRASKEMKIASWDKSSNPKKYATYQTRNLDEIDKEICDWLCVPLHATEFSHAYEAIIDSVLASMMALGGTYAEQHHFDWMLERWPPMQLDASFHDLVKHLILGPYLFEAWYSPR